MSRDYFWPNRTICEVLAEMRKCHETRNYSYLPGLIEEAQYLGSKMEGAIGDKNDVVERERRLNELKKEIRAARAELDGLKKDD